jgi:hypothetical protein
MTRHLQSPVHLRLPLLLLLCHLQSSVHVQLLLLHLYQQPLL